MSPKNTSDSNKNNKKPKKTSATTKKASASKAKVKAIYSKELYDTLVNETSIIFLYPETITLLKNNDKLQSTIEFFINAIYTYEQNTKVQDKKSEEFKAAYKSITKKDITFKMFDKNQVDDIEDEINFLKVFIKNTLNLDWNDIVNSFKNNQQKIETVTPIVLGKEEKINENNNEHQNNNFNNNANIHDFMSKNQYSMDQLADAAITQQATYLVQQDIAQNKLYQYKTKPTFFLIIKWLLFSFWILTAIVLIINAFSLVGLNNGIYIFIEKYVDGYDNIGNLIPPDSNQNALIQIIANNGFFINNGAASIIGYIFSVLFPLMIVWYAFIQIKNYKNDNAKFTCKTFISWLLLIWIFIILITSDVGTLGRRLDINSLNRGMDLNIPNQNFIVDNINFTINQQLVGTGLLIDAISIILYFVCIALTVILSTIILIVRPHVDSEKIQNKIYEYIAKIKSGEIPFDNGMTGSRGMNPFSPF